jgi:hypothetical protein
MRVQRAERAATSSTLTMRSTLERAGGSASPPPQPRRFFQLLWERMLEPELGSALLAYLDRTPVAGAPNTCFSNDGRWAATESPYGPAPRIATSQTTIPVAPPVAPWAGGHLSRASLLCPNVLPVLGFRLSHNLKKEYEPARLFRFVRHSYRYGSGGATAMTSSFASVVYRDPERAPPDRDRRS